MPCKIPDDVKAAGKKCDSQFFGELRLIADGAHLLVQSQLDRNTFRKVVYIDGYIKGEHAKAESPIGQKYWRPVKSALAKGKKAEECKKLLKRITSEIKRARVADRPFREEQKARLERWITPTHIFNDPSFASAKALLAHLAKTCDSVQLAPAKHDDPA